jgi:CDP-2,3-bis-(O-geranylgeranyl)-sn-glycerol synthase
MNWSPFTNALLLLICANLLPWAAGRLLGAYWSAPLDLGTCLHDGRRLLGAHKTWRGLAAAIAGCALAAEVVGLQWWIGALFGALSMLGDSISSWSSRWLPRCSPRWTSSAPECDIHVQAHPDH